VQVALYFFDTRDDDQFIEDDEGVELADIAAVKRVAATALVELARDVVPGAMQRNLSVEVRDDNGLVLASTLRFEALILRPTLQEA
jgi:hypothetical protein